MIRRKRCQVPFLRAKLVKRAEHWRWGSAWRRVNRKERELLDEWTTPRPNDYLSWLNEKESDDLLEKLRTSVNRSRPFGSESWSKRMIKRFDLHATVVPRGRPKKGT